MSNPIVSFDEEAVKSELRELVRKTIEETINAMLDEEADQLVGAAPYERTDGRAAYRAGHCKRGFTTTSGQVALRMPKLKGMRFATAVIERYKRRETSVERPSSRCTWPACRRGASRTSARSSGARAAGTVSNLNDKAFKAVEEGDAALACEYPHTVRRRHLPEAKLGRLNCLPFLGLEVKSENGRFLWRGGTLRMRRAAVELFSRGHGETLSPTGLA